MSSDPITTPNADEDHTCQTCRHLVRSFLPVDCNEPFFCDKLGATLAYAFTEERHDCWESQ